MQSCLHVYSKNTNPKKNSGGHYYTYRIVESQRIGEKVTQRTLLNLGVDFSFPEEQW